MENKKVKKQKQLKEKEIEKLGKKIEELNTLDPEDKKKIKKKVFITLFMSAISMFVFIFVLMGYNNISMPNYLTDLKVFSIIAIIVTIFIFERAYKNDNDAQALVGIESLIASFVILSLGYVLEYNIFPYRYYLIFFACVFVAYYFVKAIVIYFREKHKYRKSVNDIKNIVKKEEI